MTTYRPILLAKRGELTALDRLPATEWSALQPVYQVAPRDWNFETSAYEKTMEQHLRDLPKKLAKATKRNTAYIDISLLDSVLPVFGGLHPLTWLVDESASLGLELTPFVEPGTDRSTLTAAADLHSRLGRSIAVRLPIEAWLTVDAARLPALLSVLGISSSDVELFVDMRHEFSPLAGSGLLAELAEQDLLHSFRTRTVGGAAFPVTQGIPKGLGEFDRSEWKLFREVHRARVAGGFASVDFFDYGVNNPSVDVGLVDPKILSISALFRYTTAEHWLIVKGELFKGNGGRGIGSRAMAGPLGLLVAHAEYAKPTRTATEDWIDSVVAGTQNGGNAEAWRKWATLRHILVVGNQIASPI